MKYLITIKDTETGGTVVEENSDCIIYAAHNDKHTNAGILGKCGGAALANSYQGVKEILEKIDKEHPEIKVLCGIERVIRGLAKDENQ